MNRAPLGWPVRPIGDLVDVLDGRRVPVSASERATRAGDVPYYGATGQVGWINEALFNEELVLLGEDGVQFFDPIKPKAYRVTGRAWVNNHAHVLRPRTGEIDGRYLTYYLNQLDYRGLANGTTRLKLTQAAMRRIVISAPSIGDQRRIVDILEGHLSRLDATATSLTLADRRALSLRWVSLTQAVDDAGGDLWSLGQLAVSVKNGIFVSRPGSEPSGIPILRIGAVRSLSLDLSDLRYSGKSLSEVRNLDGLLSSDDVIFTRYNGNPDYVGACANVSDAALPLTYPDKLIRVRVDRSRVLPQFLAIACSVGAARAQIRASVKTTSGQAGISGRDLKSVEVHVPPIAVQQTVIRRSDALGEATTRLRRSLAAQSHRSERLRRALLHAAFSGQLTGRPSDLERAAGSIA